jgi:hypothetical protein
MTNRDNSYVPFTTVHEDFLSRPRRSNVPKFKNTNEENKPHMRRNRIVRVPGDPTVNASNLGQIYNKD